MKKIILILALSLFAFADFPKMETLLIQQSSIAIGVDAFIKNRGTIPTDITALVNAGYLPSDFNASNPVDGDNITFSVSNQQIFINSQVESDKVDAGQIDYYVNTMAYRDLGRVSKVENSQLVSYYTLSSIGALNLNVNSMFGLNVFKGNSDPTLYASVVNGNFWFSSTFPDNMYQAYLRDSDVWKSLDSYSKNFDPISKTFVNTKTIPLTKSYWDKQKVSVLKQVEAIKCNNGETYNPAEDRCEAYTSNACDTANGYYYDSNTKLCTKTSYASKITTTGYDDYSFNVWLGKVGDDYLNAHCQGYTYKATFSVKDVTKVVSFKLKKAYFDDWIKITINGHIVHVAPYGGDMLKITYDARNLNVVHSGTCGNATSIWSAYVQYTSSGDAGTCEQCTNWRRNYDIEAKQYLVNGNNNVEIYVIVDGGGEGYSYFEGLSTLAGNMSCTGGYCTESKTLTTVETCSPGYTDNGTNCVKIETENPTCAGKKMPVSPYYDTPYYGNNGVCYSDAGLYCQKTGVSWDGIYTCYDHSEHCDNTTWNLDYSSDVCQKYQYSCDAGYYRYGLSESPTNSDATDLYNRIANPDDKLNTVVQYILKQDVNVNDNAGALCASLRYSDFSQPTISPTYTIDGFDYSAF